MFSVKITGRITGAEFILSQRYSTREECERVVKKIIDAHPSSNTIRSVHQHNVGQLTAAAAR